MFKCALSLSKDPKSMDNYNSCDQLVLHTVIQSSAMLLSVSAKLDHGFHQWHLHVAIMNKAIYWCFWFCELNERKIKHFLYFGICASSRLLAIVCDNKFKLLKFYSGMIIIKVLWYGSIAWYTLWSSVMRGLTVLFPGHQSLGFKNCCGDGGKDWWQSADGWHFNWWSGAVEAAGMGSWVWNELQWPWKRMGPACRQSFATGMTSIHTLWHLLGKTKCLWVCPKCHNIKS